MKLIFNYVQNITDFFYSAVDAANHFLLINISLGIYPIKNHDHMKNRYRFLPKLVSALFQIPLKLFTRTYIVREKRQSLNRIYTERTSETSL